MSASVPTRRAAVLEEFGVVPGFVERPVPTPDPGETLVRLHAASVAHLDRDIVRGTFALLPDLPHVPGTEAAGVVVSGGPHPAGRPVRVRGGGVGVGRDGTWAEVVAVPDEAVHPLPDDADPVVAACFFSPVATAVAAVQDLAGVEAGQRVMVTGAGGAVGACVVQLAARAGASVVAVVGREAKRGHVPAVADEVVLPAELAERPAAGIDQLVDHLIDTVGGPALPTTLGHVAPGGRAVLVGYTAGAELTLDLRRFLVADVALLPMNLLRRSPGLVERADEVLVEIGRGHFDLPVQRFPAGALGEALERLGSGELVGRAVIELEGANP